MLQSLSYTEMNHAVPRSTFSPRMEQYFECEVTSPSQWSNPCRSPQSLHSPNHFPECEVPSPSQWSDPCRSPPSLHSPTHFPADLEKFKEEPFSPPSAFQSLLQIHRPMSREGFENSISLAELLEENASLIKQHSYPHSAHHHQQQHQQHQHQQQQQQLQHPVGFKVDGDLKSDLEDIFTVKKEIVESETSIYSVSSTSTSVGATSSFLPAPTVVQPQVNVGDSLRTVELMALDYYRQYVQRVSYKLGIAKDPNAWSTSNVRSWLEYEAEQQGLPPPSLGSWNWTGADLSRFTEAQFREMIPHGGELYYAKLEIWREALRTSYQTDSSVRNLPSTAFSMPPQLQYLHPSITQTHPPPPPPTQPLTVHIQPQGSSQYHHYVPQMYQSPTSSSSSFSPPGMMISPVPPPLIQLPPSPSQSPRHSQPSQIPPSPLQVPATVIQVEQQKQQQKTQQQPQENAPKSPQKQRLSPTPSAPSTSCERAESPSELFRNTFMEKCIDVTTLLKSPAEVPEPQTNIEATDEVLESEDEAEKEPSSVSGNRGGTHIHLWQFLKELLLHPQLYGSCIRWLDRSKGVFKIEDSVRVARLWGKRKNRPAMNYDKLSRSIRQYYKKNIMKKTERSQRLVYQFCHPYGL